METGKVRTAVIGVGYLGRWPLHAEKMAKMDNAELVGVVDTDLERAQKVAKQWGHPGVCGLPRAFGQGGCGQRCHPPPSPHHQVTKDFLSRRGGCDVRKTHHPHSGRGGRADHPGPGKRPRILQVGHLERFNPAVEETFRRVTQPFFIECNRIARPIRPRATRCGTWPWI